MLTDAICQKFSQGNVDTDPDEWLGVTQDETDTIVLRRYFEKHADKIGKELLSTSNISAQDSANGKTTWDDLCAAIIELGTPNVEPKLSGLDSWVHEGYADLMERYNHRNTDPVRDMWIEAPMPSVSVESLCCILTLTWLIRINQRCS